MEDRLDEIDEIMAKLVMPVNSDEHKRIRVAKKKILAWRDREVAMARADEISQIISDGIYPEDYLLDRVAAHRKQALSKSNNTGDRDE